LWTNGSSLPRSPNSGRHNFSAPAAGARTTTRSAGSAARRRRSPRQAWIRRTKKAQVPPGADARDRAIFEKSKDHLIRVDDDVTCKTCGKRFEIPSHRGLVFLEELEGLPQEDYDE